MRGKFGSKYSKRKVEILRYHMAMFFLLKLIQFKNVRQKKSHNYCTTSCRKHNPKKHENYGGVYSGGGASLNAWSLEGVRTFQTQYAVNDSLEYHVRLSLCSPMNCLVYYLQYYDNNISKLSLYNACSSEILRLFSFS